MSLFCFYLDSYVNIFIFIYFYLCKEVISNNSIRRFLLHIHPPPHAYPSTCFVILCFLFHMFPPPYVFSSTYFLLLMLPPHTCQSSYRPGHSTETALLKVVNDLFLSLNKGNMSVLALLDFSSAFDTIDHTILVHRLHTDFGFTDTVLQWFSSYLTDRTQYVSLCNHCSDFPSCTLRCSSGFSSWPYAFHHVY